jgi:hypothetical protein
MPVGDIHNTKHRMPAILEKADREAWLTGRFCTKHRSCGALHNKAILRLRDCSSPFLEGNIGPLGLLKKLQGTLKP